MPSGICAFCVGGESRCVARVDGKRLWEKQEWESHTAWQRFHTYYLGQSAPRSVDAAWRRWKREQLEKRYMGATQALQKALDKLSTQRANGTWRRWSQGRDKDGRRLLTTSGVPVPTWAERAEAYDRHQARLEHEANRRKRRKALSTALDKTIEALQAVDANGASFGQLATMLRAVVSLSQSEFGDLPAQEIRHSGAVASVQVQVGEDVDTDYIAGVLSVLAEVGAIPPPPETLGDAEDDALHSAPPDAEASSVSAADVP